MAFFDGVVGPRKRRQCVGASEGAHEEGELGGRNVHYEQCRKKLSKKMEELPMRVVLEESGRRDSFLSNLAWQPRRRDRAHALLQVHWCRLHHTNKGGDQMQVPVPKKQVELVL